MSSRRNRNNRESIRSINHTRLKNEQDFELHYQLQDLLGKGSFGTVTEAIRNSDKKKWAVKVINKEKAGSTTVRLLEREVSIMKKVDHRNIIHLEEVFETSNKMYLVMELCLKGGLSDVLEKEGFFTEKDVLCIVQQLIDAIAYMHANDIIHRDLKLDNILLAAPTEQFIYNIKLTDFGLSYTRGGSGSDYMMNQVVGTPIYMAPEVITSHGYSQQCDIWSAGVIVYQLFCGEPPFIANKEDELFALIKKGELTFVGSRWDFVSASAKQMLEGMMKVDPAHRLTSKEILRHPWILGSEDTNGCEITNVLEMMKQYNMELKAEQKKKESNQSSSEELLEVETEVETMLCSSSKATSSKSSSRSSLTSAEKQQSTKRTHTPMKSSRPSKQGSSRAPRKKE